MSNVILVLQKVTTFPIETIIFPPLCDISSSEVHKYYSETIRKNPPIKPKSSASAQPEPLPAPNTSITTTSGTVSDVDINKINGANDNIKKRFVVYNAIYDKLNDYLKKVPAHAPKNYTRTSDKILSRIRYLNQKQINETPLGLNLFYLHNYLYRDILRAIPRGV